MCLDDCHREREREREREKGRIYLYFYHISMCFPFLLYNLGISAIQYLYENNVTDTTAISAQ